MDGESSVTMKWQIHSMGRFYDANESTVVYFDTHSGDTHLLSDFAAFILQQLCAEPLGIEELIARITPSIDSPDTSDLRLAVQAVLGELETLDILKRA